MLSILYLLLFLAGGVWSARMLLPGRRPLVRLYIGLSLGVLLLPVLAAVCPLLCGTKVTPCAVLLSV